MLKDDNIKLWCNNILNFDKNKILGIKKSDSDALRDRLLKFIDDELGISQRKFAIETGIPYQKLNKLINGETKVIDVELVAIFVIKKKMNPIWFFTGKGPRLLNEGDLIGTQFNEPSPVYLRIGKFETMVEKNKIRIEELETRVNKLERK